MTSTVTMAAPFVLAVSPKVTCTNLGTAVLGVMFLGSMVKPPVTPTWLKNCTLWCLVRGVILVS